MSLSRPSIEEAILTKHVAAFEARSDCGIVLGKLLASDVLSEFEYQRIWAERTQIERNRLVLSIKGQCRSAGWGRWGGGGGGGERACI